MVETVELGCGKKTHIGLNVLILEVEGVLPDINANNRHMCCETVSKDLKPNIIDTHRSKGLG